MADFSRKTKAARTSPETARRRAIVASRSDTTAYAERSTSPSATQLDTPLGGEYIHLPSSSPGAGEGSPYFPGVKEITPGVGGFVPLPVPLDATCRESGTSAPNIATESSQDVLPDFPEGGPHDLSIEPK